MDMLFSRLAVRWCGLPRSKSLLVLMAWSIQGMLPLAAHSATSPIQAFTGQWQVQQVLLDEERTDRFLYQFNDPRLVGRMVSIDERRIESDLPEASDCARPVLVSEPQALNTLLGQTMPSALSGQDAVRAFGLKVPGKDVVNVVWISCATSRFGPSLNGTTAASLNKPGRTWMALPAANQLLMRWYGDTVLVLEPRASDQPIHPSFSCGQARLPAEKAICASASLASYDVSLSQAWHAALQACEGERGCLGEARRAQKQWVAVRNRCERDEICLRQAMRTRLDDLMTPPAD